MATIAKETGTFTKAPEGVHPGICVDVIDLGMVHSEKFGSSSHKIDVVFQLGIVNPDNDKRFLVRSRFTLSLSPKANLRGFLESWRGKKFTTEELKDGFDVEKLIGANALVNIVHNGDWANIQAVMPLVQGTPKLTAENYVRQTSVQQMTQQPAVQNQMAMAAEIPTGLPGADDEVPF